MAGWTVKFDATKIEKLTAEGAAEGLKIAVEQLRAESERICPKDRGYNGGLVSTASTEVDEQALTARLRYTAPHAWLQHEKHYKHKPGEQGKYIEAPLVAFGPALLSTVAESIRTKLK